MNLKEALIDAEVFFLWKETLSASVDVFHMLFFGIRCSDYCFFRFFLLDRALT